MCMPSTIQFVLINTCEKPQKNLTTYNQLSRLSDASLNNYSIYYSEGMKLMLKLFLA